VYIPGREKQVFEKVASLNTGPLTDDAIKAIYREVMSASISLQKEVSIAYLGPPGTYSHQVRTTLSLSFFPCLTPPFSFSLGRHPPLW